ncbi:hypothetical protein M9H77_35993 [Catharanthus roseus]|uniref:Uncharacterized protein n=1 Tax=Catharanthus roseus TaxID=4058 RepID=A0ACB9ZSG6_CATRO|nr:hypothetical protein M9H77_35993 [Catharanthus roseus]
MGRRFHKRRDDYERYFDSHYYEGYSCGKISQTLGTISRPPNYNNLKLLLLCGTFGPYDCEAWEQELESLFYCYCVREEEKFQLVLKSFSYVVNDWWDCNCEYRRRMGLKPIKPWSLTKQTFTSKCGVKNNEEQRQGQTKVKFLESLMGEKSTKVDELSQVQDRKATHHEKKKTYTFVKDRKSYTMNPFSPQQVHQEQRKMREKEKIENEMKKKSIREDKIIEGQDGEKKMSDQKKESAMEEKRRLEQESFNEEQSVIESISTSLEECECKKSCLIKNHESLKEEEKEEKQVEIEKSEETKEGMSSFLF